MLKTFKINENDVYYIGIQNVNLSVQNKLFKFE